jgi:hypothetical protein
VDTGKNLIDPVGVDVARIGLGAPSWPSLVGEIPRPSGLGMEHDIGCYYRFSFVLCFM